MFSNVSDDSVNSDMLPVVISKRTAWMWNVAENRNLLLIDKGKYLIRMSELYDGMSTFFSFLYTSPNLALAIARV